MFQRCFDDKQYKQAVGIALETRRIDVFENAILQSDDVPGMLAYSLKVCVNSTIKYKKLKIEGTQTS